MAIAGLGFEAASITELSLGHTAHMHAASTTTTTATAVTSETSTETGTSSATSRIRLVFDSPAKTRAELYVALQQPGVLVNCNCFSELDRIAAIIAATTTANNSTSATSIQAKVGIRINPLIGAGTVAEMSVAADATSKFGVPLTPLNRARIIAAFSKYDWLVGLHVHVGSQVKFIYLKYTLMLFAFCVPPYVMLHARFVSFLRV
jgi:diaminopimelate decarboxylase